MSLSGEAKGRSEAGSPMYVVITGRTNPVARQIYKTEIIKFYLAQHS